MDVTLSMLTMGEEEQMGFDTDPKPCWPLNLAAMARDTEGLEVLQASYMDAKERYARAVMNWAYEVLRRKQKLAELGVDENSRLPISIELGKLIGDGLDPYLVGRLIEEVGPLHPWYYVLPVAFQAAYGDEGKDAANALISHPAAIMTLVQDRELFEQGVEEAQYDDERLALLQLARCRKLYAVDVLKQLGRDNEGVTLAQRLSHIHFLAAGNVSWRGKVVRRLREEGCHAAAEAIIRDSYIKVELAWSNLLIWRGRYEMARALVR